MNVLRSLDKTSFATFELYSRMEGGECVPYWTMRLQHFLLPAKFKNVLWYKPQTQNIVLLIVLRKMHWEQKQSTFTFIKLRGFWNSCLDEHHIYKHFSGSSNWPFYYGTILRIRNLRKIKGLNIKNVFVQMLFCLGLMEFLFACFMLFVNLYLFPLYFLS